MHHNPNALAVVERSRGQAPGARFVVIEGHHYVHNSNLEHVGDELRAFLSHEEPQRR